MVVRLLPSAASVGLVLALAACGTSTSAAGSLAGPSTSTTVASSARLQDPVAVARVVAEHYDAETGGKAVHRQLRRVIADPGLVAALQSGDVVAARAAAARLIVGKAHISRVQVRRDGRKIVDVGVPFCVAGPSATIRAPDGRALGVATVSIQDEIGVVRLLHRHNPAHVFIKGSSGTARTSLQPARHVRLPTTGSVTIQGQRYAVASFRRRALDHERVRVTILTQR